MALRRAFLVICFLATCSCFVLQGNGADIGESSQECGGYLFKVNKYTCCKGKIQEGAHLACCGTSAHNVLESSCCEDNVTHGLGQAVSDCCGSVAFNPINQICCEGVIMNRPGARATCCGPVAINEETHLCCKETTVQVKKTEFHRCCGNDVYDSKTQCCCSKNTFKVENRSNSTCCQKNQRSALAKHLTKVPQSQTKEKGQAEGNQLNQLVTKARTDCSYCGLKEYDRHTSICCSDRIYTKKSGLTQCCGAQVYQQWEDGSLCCDEVLYRDRPAGSVCKGKYVVSPNSYTVCQGHANLPAGEHCCGSDTFDPHTQICCSGYRHNRLGEGMACCGPHVYDRNSHGNKCCSGHLHVLKHTQSEATCCGSRLLRKNEQCCQSLVYKVQEGHACCGHWYYNTSLWECCAGRLAPLRTDSQYGQRHEFKHLPHLSDFNITTICTEKVLLGTVSSEAVNQTLRSVVLVHVMYVLNNTITPERDTEVTFQDHCSFPLLKPGKTYLWRNSGTQYKPIINVTDEVSLLHSILSHCLVFPTSPTG